MWVEITDPSAGELDDIAATFGLHPLTVEDMAHRRQRPRVEVFDGYVFVALQAVTVTDDVTLDEVEVHLVAGDGYLLAFSAAAIPGEVATALTRCERHPDLLAGAGSGYALYVALDEIVDGYLGAVERLEDSADELEDRVFGGAGTPGDGFQEAAFHVKRAVVRLRRAAMPLRAGIDLIREDPRLGGTTMAPYLRDVEEHLLRVADGADAIRDILTSLLEVRVGQTANDLNEVMKKLSAWAGIILVPTLIAGVYGMNFDVMPELGWGAGYPAALLLMASSAGLLYRGFKRKGWL